MARKSCFYSSALALLCGLLAFGCAPSHDEALFDRLLATDFGQGIKFDLTPGQITPNLGVPTVTTTKQGGHVAEHTYLPEGEKAAASNIPQLQLTYVDGKLAKILNLERPFETDPVQPPAPKKVTVVSGLGLGSRKSDFSSKLGEPNFGVAEDMWRFVGKDGSSITIQAFFVENPDTKQPVCSKLIIVRSPKVDKPRGEQYEGKS